MHTNRNKKAVNRVSIRMLKANKSRNFFAVIAIILTTFMITSVFSLGISYKENFDTFTIRQFGTTATISLPNPTAEQYKKLMSLDYLDAVGIQYNIGSITQKTDQNTASVISLLCYDKTEYENNFKPAISNIEGNYPQKSDEIMMSEGALAQLGIKNPVLNQTVKLNYMTSDGSRSGEFKLSGRFKSYAENVKSIILFSEKYCTDNGITPEMGGRANIFAKDDETAYELLAKDIALNGQQEFNSHFTVSETNDIIQITALMLIIVLFIMISGFLLIYNVFYISVSKEINRYGMLKTIGTTQKQIQKIIINQALILACIGIPAGVILSALFSLAIVPLVLESIAGNEFDKISFSPLIFTSAVVFSFATVLISAWKPAKTAGKISPVEALRYNTAKTSSKEKRLSKSQNGGKIYRQAWRNIFRNKKQTILVVASLFLGSITMLCINSVIGSLNAENYAQQYFKDDIAFVSENPRDKVFSEKFVKSLKEIDGIKDFYASSSVFVPVEFDEKTLESILRDGFKDSGGSYDDESYYQNFLEVMRELAENNKFGAWVQTIDIKYVEEYNKTHKEQIDTDAFINGETVISLNTGNNNYNGTELTFIDNSKKKTKVKIAGMFNYKDVNYVVNPEFIMGMPSVIFVSDNFINNIDCDPNIFSVVFNADKNSLGPAESKAEELGKNLISAAAAYQLNVRTQIIQKFREDMRSLSIIGNSVSVFLLAIGMMNFINIMMTGIFSRRREFAVMQSIGVTARQLRKLLSFEGLYYALLTVILILTAGSGILFAEAKIIPSIANYAVFEYPAVPLVILIVCILLLCLTVPFIVYKTSAKSTITERLRDIEN